MDMGEDNAIKKGAENKIKVLEMISKGSCCRYICWQLADRAQFQFLVNA